MGSSGRSSVGGGGGGSSSSIGARAFYAATLALVLCVQEEEGTDGTAARGLGRRGRRGRRALHLRWRGRRGHRAAQQVEVHARCRAGATCLHAPARNQAACAPPRRGAPLLPARARATCAPPPRRIRPRAPTRPYCLGGCLAATLARLLSTWLTAVGTTPRRVSSTSTSKTSSSRSTPLRCVRALSSALPASQGRRGTSREIGQTCRGKRGSKRTRQGASAPRRGEGGRRASRLSLCRPPRDERATSAPRVTPGGQANVCP